MGQACCADDIQVEYKGNMLEKQPTNKKQNSQQANIPVELPIVSVPVLNDKVQTALAKMNQFKSEIENYERGTYSKARKINSNGVIYEGEWKNMMPHGKGKMYFPDGSLYTGFFFNGLPDGQGRLINAHGISYQGQIKAGKACGQGQLKNQPKQYFYQGSWYDDVPHGFGKEHFGQDSYYEGNFVNGIKQGQGTYNKYNDFQYTGNFQNNLFNGEGEASYANGDSYVGGWKNGLFHGEGTYTFTSKNKDQKGEKGEGVEKYTGGYHEGVKHGKGKYTDVQNRIFQGVWEFGKRKGKGKIYAKNEITEWNWNNDRPIKKSVK